MKKIVIVIFVLIIAGGMDKVFAFSGQFSNIAGNSREMVFGEAFGVIDDDVNSLFVNPACLGNIFNSGITAGHTNLFELNNMSYDFLGLHYSRLPFYLPKGLTYRRMGVDGLVTANELGEITATNSTYSENTAGLVFYNRLPWKIGLGARVNYYFLQTVEKKEGFGLDVGIMAGEIYRKNRTLVKAGILGRNIYSVMTGGVSVENFPLYVDTGLGVDYREFKAALSHTYPGNILNLGVEYNFLKLFAVRAGLRSMGSDITLKAGLGLSFAGASFDYGYENHQSLGLTHRFSLSYQFDMRQRIIVQEVPQGARITIDGKICPLGGEVTEEVENRDMYNGILKLLPGKYEIEVWDSDNLRERREIVEIDGKGELVQGTEIIGPDPAGKKYKEGMRCLESIDYLKAREMFEAALKINDRNTDLYYQLGRCYELLGEFEKARENYNQAYQKSPEKYPFLKEILGE